MLLGIYLGSLALGGVLIAASIILGGHDADADAHADFDADADADFDADADTDFDFDADADVDVDADVDADHDMDLHHGGALAEAAAALAIGGYLPFLSLRFWTFALASFGLTGSLLHITVMEGILSLVAAIPTGVGIGWVVALVFRYLKRSSVGDVTKVQHMRGMDGTVELPIGPGKLGKISLLIDGHDVEMMASTREDKLIPVKSPVLVVDVKDNVADVVPLPVARRRDD